jgi:hypothetical protein
MTAYSGQVPEPERPASWQTQAACLGLWKEMHPENDEREIANAKAICARCPVTRECFWDAARTGDNQHGIRAGLRANERRAVLAELQERQAASPAPVKKKREPARCGSRSGYQKHVREKTQICAPCRQANTDADARLRRTGTTRVLT